MEFFILSRSFFIIISDEICRENHNTLLLLSNFFFEDRVFYKKSGWVLQGKHATNENMAHAHCMLDN